MDSNADQRNEQQAAPRRDALLLKLLETPPQPRPKRERRKPKLFAYSHTPASKDQPVYKVSIPVEGLAKAI